jgi:hypothetical protein
MSGYSNSGGNSDGPLVEGGRKKLRSAISQEEAALHEKSAEGVLRPLLKNLDNDCRSAADFFKLWVTELKPLEMQFGDKWRVDLHLLDDDNSIIKKPNTRSTWWGKRRLFFVYMEMSLDRGETEEEVLGSAETIFQDVKKSKKEIASLTKVFKATVGEKISSEVLRGRPRSEELVTLAKPRPGQQLPPQPPTPQQGRHRQARQVSARRH